MIWIRKRCGAAALSQRVAGFRDRADRTHPAPIRSTEGHDPCYDSIDDVNAFLQRRVSAYNDRPQAELGGLSPDQAAGLLEERELPPEREWDRPVEMRKTPLFDRFLRFAL